MVYLKNTGVADAMVAERWLVPGAGRIVGEHVAAKAQANYPGLEVISPADAPIYRTVRAMRKIPGWRGGTLPQGGRATMSDSEYRRWREDVEVISTALDD